MNKKYKVGAIIVAAGSGLRFGERKQFKKLAEKPLYLYSLERFIDCNLIDEIVLVVPKDLQNTISNKISKLNPRINVVEGGKLRQDSVLAGIERLPDDCDIICVHDAARPFVSVDLIQKTITACENNAGAVAAIPSNDTVKEIDTENKRIKRTIPRETIWLAQTPQTFHRKSLKKALLYARDNEIHVTDEAILLESLEHTMVVVGGSSDNFKITTSNDWKLAELIVERNND